MKCPSPLLLVVLPSSFRLSESFTASTTHTTNRLFGASSVIQHEQQHQHQYHLKATTDNEPASSGTSTLPPIPTEWKDEILKSLSSIIDPDLNADIVSLGFIKNLNLDETTRQLSFDFRLSTPAHPNKHQFQSQCEQAVNDQSLFPYTNGNAVVTLMAPPPITIEEATAANGNINGSREGASDVPFGLSQVKAIIAVSSCKGGVGKSTTSVNLAYALSNLGASVGIFDADVYGPSLPTMVTPDYDAVNFIGRQIAPLSREDVKLMSFGYVNDGSAVMRGPMVTQLLDQFLSLTYWGPLDYLILDMPPGTGDIQLTLSQRLNITAAVIVTTPQELSFVDVERGIEMFDTVNVPCVAVVENMAYLELDQNENDDKSDDETLPIDEDGMKDAFLKALQENGNEDAKNSEITNSLLKIVQESIKEAETKQKMNQKEKLRIFGKGHKERLSKQWGIEHTYSIPLMDKIAANGDNGTPFILEYPNSPQTSIYKELAGSVAREVVKIQYSKEQNRPSVNYDDEKNILQFNGILSKGGEDDKNKQLPSAELRRECKCAACVEEFTGRQILNPEDIPDSVYPTKMNPTGNYALSVDWSDGHKSLYPFKQIRSLLEERMIGLQKEEEVEEEVVSA